MRQLLNVPLGWPPHTSGLLLPMGSLGSLGEVPAQSSPDLGPARSMRDDELCEPGRVYTYRTWSSVPIDPERRVDIQLSHTALQRAGWATASIVGPQAPVILGIRLYQTIAGVGAWEVAGNLGWRVGPPRGHASFWQNRTREADGYRTSLNITATAAGVKAGALKWAARRILSFMAGSNSPDDVSRIQPGWLYERGVREESASVARRAAEAVFGRDRTRAAVELGSEIATEAEAAVLGSVAEREAEEAASRERMTYGAIGAGLLFVVGIFLATRPGSSKVERTAAAATRAVRESTSDAFTPTVRITNRKRRRRNGLVLAPVGSWAVWKPPSYVAAKLPKAMRAMVGERVKVVTATDSTRRATQSHSTGFGFRRIRFSGGETMDVPATELKRAD